MKNFVILISLILFFVLGCTENCINVYEKDILSSKNFEDTIYQKTLMTILIDDVKNKEIHYYFDSFKNKNNENYIVIKCKSDKLCAYALMKYDKIDKIDKIKKNNPESYKYAEIEGLKFEKMNNDYLEIKSIDAIND